MADRADMPILRKWHDALRLPGLRSLLFKASILLVALILTVSLSMLWLNVNSTRRAIMSNDRYRTLKWAEFLANSEGVPKRVSTQDLGFLMSAVNGTKSIYGVVTIVFAGKDGLPMTAWKAPELGPPDPADKPIPLKPLSTPVIRHNEKSGMTYMDVIVPIYLRPRPEEEAQFPPRLVGYLRFATDVTHTQDELNRIARDLKLTAFIVVLLVVPISILATNRVVGPIREVARAAQALARGAMDERAPVHSHDEVGDLARTFNFMADQVARTQGELRELNKDLESRVAQRTRDLEEQAARDPLTGLYNRRYFGEVIAHEFSAAERYGPDLTCLMFDVDHFKAINDRHGHRTGDKVLMALSDAISAELRSSDVAARFGGDEFILLLPQTAAGHASVLADRIVSRFAKNVNGVMPGVNATLSIGVASLRTTRARSSEALIHEADIALYAAKQSGRNRTIHAVGAV